MARISRASCYSSNQTAPRRLTIYALPSGRQLKPSLGYSLPVGVFTSRRNRQTVYHRSERFYHRRPGSARNTLDHCPSKVGREIRSRRVIYVTQKASCRLPFGVTACCCRPRLLLSPALVCFCLTLYMPLFFGKIFHFIKKFFCKRKKPAIAGNIA